MAMAGQKGGKVFYGWWIVLAAGIGLFVHWAPIVGFTFGVFLKSFSQEFGWSRAQVSLAFSLSTLGMTVAVPFLGRLVDRFGARRVIMPAALLFGLGVLFLSLLSAHLWHFYAIFVVMGVGFDSTGSYGLVLGIFVVATLAAAGLMSGLGPYREWVAAAEPA